MTVHNQVIEGRWRLLCLRSFPGPNDKRIWQGLRTVALFGNLIGHGA